MTVGALEWSYNPWRDHPGRAAVAVVAALACCVLVTSLKLPGFAMLVLCVVCVASLGIAFLPVRCRLDETGVTRRSGWLAERRPWQGLHRAIRTPEGILLSPFRSRHWLEAYRALFLPLPANTRSSLADDVDRILTSHGL
jgi:hypothetical protein